MRTADLISPRTRPPVRRKTSSACNCRELNRRKKTQKAQKDSISMSDLCDFYAFLRPKFRLKNKKRTDNFVRPSLKIAERIILRR
jgi:hypothetical protein